MASLEFFLRSLRSRRMAATNENPCSPEFTKEEIEAYTPSNESEDSLDFFGRRRLRIMNGQDPVLHPKSFTPLVSQRMQWPTNDEAFEWAEPARKKGLSSTRSSGRRHSRKTSRRHALRAAARQHADHRREPYSAAGSASRSRAFLVALSVDEQPSLHVSSPLSTQLHV